MDKKIKTKEKFSPEEIKSMKGLKDKVIKSKKIITK